MQVKGTGRIGKIEKKTSQKGKDYAYVSIATSYKVNEVWETIWYKGVAFGECNVEKGDLVSFEGNMDANVYTNKDGVKVVEPKLILNVLAKLEKKEKTADEQFQKDDINW